MLAGLIAAGVAGAATLDRPRTFATSLTALDMSGQAVAAATAWAPGHCESVDLWSPDLKVAYTFQAPGPSPRTSTGRGIASVATSYNRSERACLDFPEVAVEPLREHDVLGALRFPQALELAHRAHRRAPVDA